VVKDSSRLASVRAGERGRNARSAREEILRGAAAALRESNKQASERVLYASSSSVLVLVLGMSRYKSGGTQQQLWSGGNLAMGNEGGGGGGGGGGAELELPQDLLSVLPSDPYEQLDVARRITAMAVTARVAKLESETGKLRLKLAEKEHVIHDLQERVGDAESSLQETTARLSHALDEQAGSTLTPPPPPPPPSPVLLSCHSFSVSVSFCFSDSLSLVFPMFSARSSLLLFGMLVLLLCSIKSMD
jgi:hypothetical protein